MKNFRVLKSSLATFCVLVMSLYFVTSTTAQCNNNCKKLRTAKVIGIKKVKESYLRKKMTTFPSEKAAYARGHRRFISCERSSKPKAGRCGEVYAIRPDKVYFCTSQLKPFTNTTKAQAAGYSDYTKCGMATPTPTATATLTATPTNTPAVTPLAIPFSFTADAGSSFGDVDTISMSKLNNGTYRSYTAASSNATDPDTLRFTDAADGLTFGAKTAITGLVPDNLETFAAAAHLQRVGGTHIMIYEEIKHISSAGLSIHNVMRGVSNDGQSFSYSPAFIVILDGSSLSNNFSPALVTLADDSLRLYYSVIGDHKTRTSTDDGATWSDSTSVVLMGRSTNFAPYPSDLHAVRSASGKFYLFFASTPTEEVTYRTIYMAESSDGVNYHVYDQPILSGSENLTNYDPNPILLPDGRIRIYYIERNGPFGSVTRNVKSIVTNTSVN